MTKSTDKKPRSWHKGISLIEIALCLVIVSLALAPIVQMVGGPAGANGTATRVNSVKNRTAMLANSLAEEAISGNVSRINGCGGFLNPTDPRDTTAPPPPPPNGFPADGNAFTYPACTDTATYGTPMTYQWRIYNPNDSTPGANQYYLGTLTVTDATGGTTTVPVRFFSNTGSGTQGGGRTGLEIAVDFSGSMAWACKTPSDAPGPPAPSCTTNVPVFNGITSPYMINRYNDPSQVGPFGGLGFRSWNSGAYGHPIVPVNMAAAPITLNMWDDRQLDMVVGNTVFNPVEGAPARASEDPDNGDGVDPDLSTPNNESFPHALPAAFAGTVGAAPLDNGFPNLQPAAGAPHFNFGYRATWGTPGGAQGINAGGLMAPPASGVEDSSILGTGNCAQDPRNANMAAWQLDPYLRHAFLPEALGHNGQLMESAPGPTSGNTNFENARQRIWMLCKAHRYRIGPNDNPVNPWNQDQGPTSGGPNGVGESWSWAVNHKLSRFEAARTAALSLMLSLENNSTVRDNLDIGYFAWGAAGTTRYEVPLQGAVAVPEAGGARKYRRLREQLLWVNRADPRTDGTGSSGVMFGGTDTRYGIRWAARRLFPAGYTHWGGLPGTATQQYQKRIIVLLTDGVPSPPDGSIQNQVDQMFGNNVIAPVCADGTKECRQITMFTVGLLGPDDNMLTTMAGNTPEGQYFPVHTISSLGAITSSISYKIQLATLQAAAGRYGY